jgi:hypothetical protein
MRTIRHLLLTAGMLGMTLVTGALAHEAPISIQADEVGTYTSQPGESYVAFVTRVAQTLNAWSLQNHQEACGAFAKAANGTYQIQLTTEHSQLVCLITVEAPAGMALVGDSLHSHVASTDSSGEYRVTDADRAAFKAMGDWTHASKSNRWEKGEGGNDKITNFSNDDYDSGPGYLVAEGQLLHQHGRGTSTVITASL